MMYAANIIDTDLFMHVLNLYCFNFILRIQNQKRPLVEEAVLKENFKRNF